MGKTLQVESSPPSEACRQLVERVTLSRQFRKSPRLREFLLFLVERSLEGHPNELTEANIGCQVFERPPGYRPAEDNIVRVSVRQLRSKLKEYFDSEGRDEEFTLAVPPGGYIPVFKPAEQAALPPGTAAGWWRWTTAAASVVVVLALALAASFWHENRTLKAALKASGAASVAPTLVSEFLLNSNQPVTVVMSDYGLVLMQNLLGGDGHLVTLDDYARRGYLARSPNYQELPLVNLWHILATRQITSVDSVTLVGRLLKAHPDRRDQILIRHARSMDIRDFKTGNFILQGGAISVPWSGLFERDLNFHRERVDGKSFFNNRNPQPGERIRYTPSASGAPDETSYAQIALLPNLSGTGKVLLIAGYNMAASEAAAEFVLSPPSVPLLKLTLGLNDLARIGRLELLLETSALAGSGHGARIVAFRR